jgi:hypothetical protein
VESGILGKKPLQSPWGEMGAALARVTAVEIVSSSHILELTSVACGWGVEFEGENSKASLSGLRKWIKSSVIDP